jgi:hypothetical protein
LAPIALEGPDEPDDLYLARGEDVALVAERPLFTGDVLDLGDEGVVMLLQHPCSMRSGSALAPQLIVAGVRDSRERAPSDWTTHAKRMFLPEFTPGATKCVEFSDVRTISSSLAEGATRLAVLSQRGVNLLLQRWVHHLTRVIVPTGTVHASIAAEHEEADLIGEEVSDLVASGLDPRAAAKLVDDWLDADEGGKRRRLLLRDPQARSDVRRRLRAQAREWVTERDRDT